MCAVTHPVEKAINALAGKASSWNLRLDKLCFRFHAGAEAKKEALVEVRGVYEKQTETHTLAISRLQALRTGLGYQSGINYREITLINSTRLLLHLGRSSVLENVGLYAERITGLPIIPGTAVKGIVSAWACLENNQRPDGSFPDEDRFDVIRPDLQGRILGTNDGQADAGDIIFLGGFPVSVPKLVLDIITPHHDTKGRPQDPKPNPFLAVDVTMPPTIWVFPLLASRRAGAEAADRLNSAGRWLTEALTQIGIGAKTASGYGRFRELTTEEKTQVEAGRKALADKLAEDQRKREALEKEQAVKVASEKAEAARLASLSPQDRAYEEFKKTIGDGTAVAREILTKPEAEQNLILRFFRSEEGRRILKGWTNEKGKRRIENLKKAGL